MLLSTVAMCSGGAIVSNVDSTQASARKSLVSRHEGWEVKWVENNGSLPDDKWIPWLRFHLPSKPQNLSFSHVTPPYFRNNFQRNRVPGVLIRGFTTCQVTPRLLSRRPAHPVTRPFYFCRAHRRVHWHCRWSYFFPSRQMAAVDSIEPELSRHPS